MHGGESYTCRFIFSFLVMPFTLGNPIKADSSSVSRHPEEESLSIYSYRLVMVARASTVPPYDISLFQFI